jgi:tetratricopeptide (TPR) repeat protein/TolB-like protein
MQRRVRAGNLVRLAGAAALFGLLPGVSLAQSAADRRSASLDAGQHAHYLVFPFENRSADPRLEWLSDGLEELTIQRLTAYGQHVYTHEGRTAELERYGLPSSARLSRATMLRLAGDLDVDYLIFGSFTSDGKTLTVEGRLLRVTPAALAPAARESGPLDSLMDLLTRVVWRLLVAGDPTFPLSFNEFSRLQRPLRLDAFEHFIRGHLAVDDEPRARELREAARLEPDWPDPVFALGQASFTRRDCTTAITWFARVPKTHDRYLESVFSTGVCRLWLNQPDRAEEVFVALEDRLKNSAAAGDLPEILNNLAIARERSGKTPAAQADLLRAADLDPEESDYPFNLGMLALRAGDFPGAAARFRETVRRQPDDPEARAFLIHSLERAGQKTQAEAERAAAAEIPGLLPLPPVKPETFPRLDRIKTELDTTALLEDIETADLSPTPPAGSTPAAANPSPDRAGRRQLSAGHLPEAEREFRAALALEPRDPAAHRGLGEVLHRLQRLDEAAAEYRASLEIRDSATVRTALARVYLEQKKTDLARQELEKALKLAPNYAGAKQLLQRLSAAHPGAPQ